MKQFCEALMDIANKAAVACPERLRVAFNEADSSAIRDQEAAHFLKLNGARHGRDIELYAFIAKFAGPEYAAAEFAQTIVTLPKEAIAAVKDDLMKLASFMGEEYRDKWREAVV